MAAERNRILDSIQIGRTICIFRVDSDGEIVEISEFAKKHFYESSICGRQFQSLITDPSQQKRWIEIFPPTEIINGFKAALSCGREKIDNRIWMEISCIPSEPIVKNGKRSFLILLADRTREEIALQNLEAFKKVCDKLPYPFHILKPNGKISYVNDAELRLFARDRREVRDHEIVDLMPASERPEAKKRINKKFTGKQYPDLGVERTFSDPDGKSNMPLAVYDWPIRETSGQISEIRSFLIDLRLGEAVETALTPSDGSYENIIQEMGLYSFRKDCNFRFIHISPSLKNLLPPGTQWKNKTDFELFDIEAARKFRADDEKLLDHNSGIRIIQDVEWFGVQGGRKRKIHVVKSVIYGANGELLGIQGTFWFLNTSFEKTKALSLKHYALRELLAGAVRSFPIGIYKAAEDGRLLYANQQLAITLGYESVADLFGVNFEKDVCIGSNDLESLHRTLKRKGVAQGILMRMKRKDGATILTMLTSKLADRSSHEQAHHEGIIQEIEDFTFDDPTEKSEQKDEFINLLSLNVSHDLKNLAANFQAIAERFRKHISGIQQMEEDDVTECFTSLMQLGRRVRTVSSEIRDLSQSEWRETHPFEIISMVRERCNPTLPDCVRFKVESDKDLPSIHTCPSMVLGIISELIGNSADKMTKKGGVILLTCRLHSEPGEKIGRSKIFLRYSVIDEGDILPESTQFLMKNVSTKPGHSGNGLYNCQLHASYLGGSIDIKNRTENLGVEATLYLPYY